MDDLSAFERQLGAVLQSAAGPSRPSDVAAYVHAATTQSPRFRFHAMFSATKSLVAGAIVVLFGGLLLATAAPGPDDNAMAPVAGASESPSRTAAATAGLSGSPTPAWTSGPTDEPVDVGAEIRRIERQVRRLTNRLQVLQRKADKTQDDRKAVQSLSEELLVLRRELGELRGVLGDRSGDTLETSTERAAAETAIEANEQQIARYEDRLDSLRRKGPKSPDDRAEISSIRSLISALQAEIGRLQRGLAANAAEAGDQASPAPNTASAPDLLRGVDLVTEEVEPGVYRVLADGAGHDLRRTHPILQVATGSDGSVWLRHKAGNRDRLIRLGQPGGHDASRLDPYVPDIEVAEDGSVWAVADEEQTRGGNVNDGLLSLHDGRWTRHDVAKNGRVTDVETAADGSVWTVGSVATNEYAACGSNGESRCRVFRPVVTRFVDGEWREMPIGSASVFGDEGAILAAVSDASVLLSGVSNDSTGTDGTWKGLLALEGGEWAPVLTIGADGIGIGQVHAGRDGTVWAYERSTSLEHWSPRFHRRMAGRWEVYEEDRTTEWPFSSYPLQVSMTVADDGTLWMAPEHRDFFDWYPSLGDGAPAGFVSPCAGVVSFDGEAWGHHLLRACATEVRAAADGSVWVVVDQEADGSPGGLYVITPEAVGTSSGLRVTASR